MTMKVTCLLLLLLCFATPVVQAQEKQPKCDCNKWPWRPEACNEMCSSNILNAADEKELVSKLGLSKELAAKVIAERKKSPFKSLNDLRDRTGFSKAEVATIESKLKALNRDVGVSLATKG